MNYRRCPYCGKNVSYFSALLEKSRGEHTCSKCHRNSTIYYSRGFKVSILATIIAALIILIVCLLPKFNGKIYDLLWVFLPFMIFYLCTPVFYKLVPLRPRPNNFSADKKRKTKKETYENIPPVVQPSSGSTRIIDINKIDAQNQIFENDNKNGETKVLPQIKS